MIDDTEARLTFAKFTGGLPPKARAIAEAHKGFICHKDITGGHFWIQRYNDDGTLWVLHGRNSVLPGLDVRQFDPDELKDCACGKWMPPSKEQMQDSRALAMDAVLANRATN
jgi:hypothetical protein